MPGLWRNEAGERTGKYLVLRRDNTVPDWPYFVIGAADPAAVAALRAYAVEALRLGMDRAYVTDILGLADEFEQWHDAHEAGDPPAPRHREDDPAVVSRLPV